MNIQVLYPLSFVVLLACDSQVQWDTSKLNKVKDTISFLQDSIGKAALTKSRLTLAYSSAIAEYLKVAYKDEKASPDTLYIGKHPDFPNTSFPDTILHSEICLIELEEATQIHHPEKYVFLNVIGHFSGNNADFIIVRFNRGSKPQHNCLIDLKYNEESQKFDQDTLRFEYPYSNRNRIKTG